MGLVAFLFHKAAFLPACILVLLFTGSQFRLGRRLFFPLAVTLSAGGVLGLIFRQRLAHLLSETKFGFFWPIREISVHPGWLLLVFSLAVAGLLLADGSRNRLRALHPRIGIVMGALVCVSLVLLLNPFVRDRNFDGPITRLQLQSHFWLAYLVGIGLPAALLAQGISRIAWLPLFASLVFVPGLFLKSEPAMLGSNPHFHLKRSRIMQDARAIRDSLTGPLLTEHGIEFAIRHASGRQAYSRFDSVKEMADYRILLYVADAGSAFKDRCLQPVCESQGSIILVLGSEFVSWWRSLEEGHRRILRMENPAFAPELRRIPGFSALEGRHAR